VQESAVRRVVVVWDDGDEAGVLVAEAGVAVGAALGATAVVPAHPAMSTEKTVAAMSRIADIIPDVGRFRGKTSLKT
jgi:hypothetical protein